MVPQVHFVVTPWRDADELLTLRRDLFASGADAEALTAREDAVSKVLAWRARKQELPLLLESTADIVEAQVGDLKNELPLHALALVYSTAISRFVTGLLDTNTDLARLTSPSQPTPLIPTSLRETRHRIVHRHLPSLAELKCAAQESLDWLWEHYWSHLDSLLSAPCTTTAALSAREVKERVQGILKTYVRERKAEVKRSSKSKKGNAADGALGMFLALGATGDVKRRVLIDLLVAEKNILPVDRKAGTSMEGAFLIWTPFLTAFSAAESSFLSTLLERMVLFLSAPLRGGNPKDDPAREGTCVWVVKILTSKEWQGKRRKLLNDVLGQCFTTPTFWTLNLAETLFQDPKLKFAGRETWLMVLEAAKEAGIEGDEAQPLPPKSTTAPDETEMDIDLAEDGEEVKGVEGEVKKICGPQRYRGLWRPRPIGWIAAEG